MKTKKPIAYNSNGAKYPITKTNDMSDKQSLFDLFVQEHDLTLVDGQLNDIIEEVKRYIDFQKHIEDAFDEGVQDENRYQVDGSRRLYGNGRDYFNKTFKEL